MTRSCTKCKQEKSLDQFAHKNKKEGTRQGWCKQCFRERLNKYYVDDPTYYKRKAAARAQKQRPEVVRLVFEYLKQHPCVDCGESDPIVLTFDHRGDKKCAVSRLMSGKHGWPTIMLEIDKCDVRCANCHARKTARDQGWLMLSLTSS